MNTRRLPALLGAAASLAAAAILLTGCLSGENQAAAQEGDATAGTATDTVAGQVLNIDFATYNPLSLIIKDQGWLEAEGVEVNWIQSAGSNKANEALRGRAVDIGSTAGSAALLARANGSPIQVIALYSQPEWSALVVPEGSAITSAEDLKGAKVAATKGTDPYFFLLQTLDEHGLDASDITVENLQHADGWAALQGGSVDAWAGLDPIMAGAEEHGAQLVYRNLDFNTYGFLNAREDFLEEKPELAQLVVDAYERARLWAAENPEETAQILADIAGLELPVAQKVILERSNLDVNGVPGQAQLDVLTAIGPVFVELGDVRSQDEVDQALATIVNDTFARNADPGRWAQ